MVNTNDLLNYCVSEQMYSRRIPGDHNYESIRDLVRDGDLKGLDRDDIWNGMVDILENWDSPEVQDQRRLEGLLCKFEQKFSYLHERYTEDSYGYGYNYDLPMVSTQDASPTPVSVPVSRKNHTPPPTGSLVAILEQIREATNNIDCTTNYDDQFAAAMNDQAKAQIALALSELRPVIGLIEEIERESHKIDAYRSFDLHKTKNREARDNILCFLEKLYFALHQDEFLPTEPTEYN